MPRVWVGGGIGSMGWEDGGGNANLCSVIPNAALKMDNITVSDKVDLHELTTLSRYISEVANLPQR